MKQLGRAHLFFGPVEKPLRPRISATYDIGRHVIKANDAPSAKTVAVSSAQNLGVVFPDRAIYR
jgi:hypothetical protein